MHTMVGAGAAEGAVDAANILKPALARGEVQAIGATTLDDYRKYVERDPALERRFQPVTVDPPNLDETIDILRGIKAKYEEHHGLAITDEALRAAATLALRYIPDRHMPDKAIDLIDEAASRVRIRNSAQPRELHAATKELAAIRKDKNEAIANQEYERAAELRDGEMTLSTKVEELQKAWDKEKPEKTDVTDDDIAQVVAMWTRIPVTRLGIEETERLRKMEEVLHEQVVGQDDAISLISKAVRRARAGLKDPGRPIGAFLFLGPTGVGKTHLVKKLADFMFSNEEAMVRLDMSEFMEKHTVARLVGAPPGYIGFDEGGQLTEAVRRKSYSVILLDEIEKAHPDVFNILLQIFEDGHLTDAKGRRVDFRNAVIIMTSNLGSDIIRRDNTLGFGHISESDETKADERYERMKTKVLDEMKRFFRPEFLNRIDGSVVFHALTRQHILEIVDLMLETVRIQLLEKGMVLQLTDRAREWLAEAGYDPTFGARPLRRLIQDKIEDTLSDELLAGTFKAGDVVELDIDGGEVTVKTPDSPAPKTVAAEAE
ncbi:MAG: AAA family ATPase, partial [Dehalococcoidia bacterium]